MRKCRFGLVYLFCLFFVSVLAETNQHPFDLPEAEAELVSGYNVEYSAMGFALFFLGESGSMILMSALTVLFFVGGLLAPFGLHVFDGPFVMALKTFCLFASLFGLAQHIRATVTISLDS